MFFFFQSCNYLTTNGCRTVRRRTNLWNYLDYLELFIHFGAKVCTDRYPVRESQDYYISSDLVWLLTQTIEVPKKKKKNKHTNKKAERGVSEWNINKAVINLYQDKLFQLFIDGQI